MKFENTNIKQVYIIKAEGFEDDRGMFRRHFCSDEFNETFFKKIYRRHTNFSCETIRQGFSGSPNWGKKISCIISRFGDLLGNVYLEVDISTTGKTTHPLWNICHDNGMAVIEKVEIEIGGQRVDKHYREWHQVWDELTTPISKSEGYKYMSGAFNNNLVSGIDIGSEKIYCAIGLRSPETSKVKLLGIGISPVDESFKKGTISNRNTSFI